jgi:hypothetical protein
MFPIETVGVGLLDACACGDTLQVGFGKPAEGKHHRADLVFAERSAMKAVEEEDQELDQGRVNRHRRAPGEKVSVFLNQIQDCRSRDFRELLAAMFPEGAVLRP